MSMMIRDNQKLNAISSQIAQSEKESFRYLNIVSHLDAEMRDTIALTTDIAECQLEVINTLMEQAPQNRAFDAVPALIDEKMGRIRADYLVNYTALVGARDAYIENNVQVVMSAERKQELIHAFTQKLDLSIGVARGTMNIDENTNLEFLKKQLEEEVNNKMALHGQLLDQKTALTTKHLDLIDKAKELKATKTTLFEQAAVSNLWDAAYVGDLNYIKAAVGKLWFWQSKSDLLNKKNSEGDTLLHIAARQNHFDVVEFLLSKEANPSIADAEGYKPLHLAAKFGFLQIVEALVNSKADINAKGSYDRAPLHMSVFNHRPQTTEFLIANGANINAHTSKADQSKTPLHDAVIQQDVLIATTLCASNELNVHAVDKNGHSAVRYAVEDGSLELLTLLSTHESFFQKVDPESPNCVRELRKISPKKNGQAIKNFLASLGNN